MCPQCGGTDNESAQVSSSHEWHRCRNCERDWWTETEEPPIYADL